MKLIFILLASIFSKIGVKSVLTTGTLLHSVNYKSQAISYTSGNAAGFNTWRVFGQNTPGNTYTNSINAIAINKDSTVIFSKYILFDTLRTYDFSMNPSGKMFWMDGKRMKVSSFNKIPLSSAQVTTALGYVPGSSSLSSVSAGYGANVVGSAPSQTVMVDTVQIMYTSKATAAIGLIDIKVNTKLNISDTTHQWMPFGTYDRSITNEIQTLSLTGQTISISSGNSIVIPTQTTALTSAQVTAALTYVPLAAEVDGSITNEIQVLSGSNTNTIALSNGGGTFIIPTQTTALTSSQVTAALGGNPLFAEVDGSITNEIQALSGSGTNTIILSNGGSFVIPTQTTVLTSGQVTAALGATPLFVEVDGSITNEIQTLSLASGSINLSLNGGSVAVSSFPISSAQVTTALGFIPSSSTLTGITASTGISITSGSIITNVIPDRTVSITAGNSSIAVSGTYPNFTLTPYTPSTFTVTRAITSATFQPSSTKLAWVFYTIRINCTATIGGASTGTVALQFSTDNGSTWIDIGQVENSNTVTLAIVLNSNTTQTGQLSGVIPAGAIVRLNQSSSGTTTITYVRGQETF